MTSSYTILLLFQQTMGLYKSFTYLFTYLFTNFGVIRMLPVCLIGLLK